MGGMSSIKRRLLYIIVFGVPVLFFDLVVFPVILQTGYTANMHIVHEWSYGIAAVVVILMLLPFILRRKSAADMD